MAKRRSIYERLALKQKLEMAKKGQAMRTLGEELERTTNIKTNTPCTASVRMAGRPVKSTRSADIISQPDSRSPNPLWAHLLPAT